MNPTVHFLNVTPGDCSIIQHGSGNVTVIDICGGNAANNTIAKTAAKAAGNFRYSRFPTNPIRYLKALTLGPIWRFIATHPDMDHLDGFNALATEFTINNFWDSGYRREKPPFDGGRYKEEDWDRYVKVRDGKDGTRSVGVLAGESFREANIPREGAKHSDGLHVVAPSPELLELAKVTEDPNDASYVIVYRSPGGKIMFTGDAHDDTFNYVLEHHKPMVANCAILIAPHHGRHSDREYAFLDVVKPKLTLFGHAPSEHLGYSAWSRRNMPILTSNRSGDVVMECLETGIHIYVENPNCDGVGTITNAQGYRHWGWITKP